MAVTQSRGDVAERVLDAVWRMESPRLIATLTRITRDVGSAEDVAQDAFVAAVQQWPVEGVPQNPAAWLTAVAKRRAIDNVRRAVLGQRKLEELGRELEVAEAAAADDEDRVDEAAIGDDLLRLVFICCHPVLSVDARVALTLRLLGGLRTDEIARAFLTSEPTIQQRIVRAKRTLAEAHVPYEVPVGADFEARLASVLQVIYLVFNEGYSATAGEDWVRPGLCEDALRLGRVLAGLVPTEAEVHGLVALMEIQASRIRARTAPDGRPISLLEQNRGRWDQLLIQRGLAALARAEALGGGSRPYALQAAIAACHARARRSEETDWPRIVALYDALAQLNPSPIVELNRAVAVGLAYGPAAGLEIADALRDEPSLASYHLLPAVRADLLAKLDRSEEAAEEFARAAAMTRNVPERRLLLERAAEATRRSVDVPDAPRGQLP
jgi:RNA polymerase sigma factor (sigma-70 family)